MKSEFQHQPVLLKEAIDYLNINPSGIYVDGPLEVRAIPGRLPGGWTIPAC